MITFVAGHRGMVGSAIVRNIDGEVLTASRNELDLENQNQVENFIAYNKPDRIILAAAKVGGIHANNRLKADFIYNNTIIQSNIIHAAHKYGVKKLLFLGSSCIYPKFCQQPMKEEYLLTGELEPTNEPYAVAKINGIKMCESYYRQHGKNFISVMPTNLYGENDRYDIDGSHVIPALILKFHLAKKFNYPSVQVWGTGKARREFMYVDDMARACLHILNNVNAEDIYEKGISHLNIGTGEDITIAEVAEMIKKTVGYEGEIEYQTEKPDGHPQKLLDITRMLETGFKPEIKIKNGLELTYKDFIKRYSNLY